jgi:hypothetical protein
MEQQGLGTMARTKTPQRFEMTTGGTPKTVFRETGVAANMAHSWPSLDAPRVASADFEKRLIEQGARRNEGRDWSSFPTIEEVEAETHG